MKQAYNLGMKTRQRYKLLLPFNGVDWQDEIYVRSSARKRCLETAQNFLNGFLSSDNNSPRHTLNLSHPIAINYVPRERDKVKEENVFLLKPLNHLCFSNI